MKLIGKRGVETMSEYERDVKEGPFVLFNYVTYIYIYI